MDVTLLNGSRSIAVVLVQCLRNMQGAQVAICIWQGFGLIVSSLKNVSSRADHSSHCARCAMQLHMISMEVRMKSIDQDLGLGVVVIILLQVLLVLWLEGYFG